MPIRDMGERERGGIEHSNTNKSKASSKKTSQVEKKNRGNSKVFHLKKKSGNSLSNFYLNTRPSLQQQCLSYLPLSTTETFFHKYSSMEFDLENPLGNTQVLHCDAVSSLFHIESEHTPPQSYFQALKARDFDISVRREVIALISQISCTLDPSVSYLAVNYLDRFLANQEILQPKSWTLRLLAISCISLASKMMWTEYSAIDIQALLNDGGIIFETQTIQRMEGLILGALQWRMRSINPFSFITFLITLISLKDPPMEQALKKRVAEIIFKSQGEIKLLEFKPSIIAASALLYASHELFPFQYPRFLTAMSDCAYVNKESVLKCYNVIQDVGMEEEEYECVINAISSSGTPVNVLDHHFLSSESENTNANGITVAASTLRQEKDLKRRKINDYGNNQTVQVSRIAQC